MKRMERLERAVGEIQRQLIKRDRGWIPTEALDLTYLNPNESNMGAMQGDEMAGVFHLPPVAANGEEAEL